MTSADEEDVEPIKVDRQVRTSDFIAPVFNDNVDHESYSLPFPLVDDATVPDVVVISDMPLRSDDHVTTAGGFEPRLQQVRLVTLVTAGIASTEPFAEPWMYTSCGSTAH